MKIYVIAGLFGTTLITEDEEKAVAKYKEGKEKCINPFIDVWEDGIKNDYEAEDVK